jgi:hypothetical protein
MKKRGQIEIGFGMIFSIILIIALIAVAFYAIKYFLDLKDCTNAGLFYQSLENKVDGAWNAVSVQDTFSGSVPGGVTKVCFGTTGLMPSAGSEAELDKFERYSDEGDNVMFSPPQKVCSGLETHKIEHVKMNNFFCVNAVDGKVQVKLSKTPSDSAVTLSN